MTGDDVSAIRAALSDAAGRRIDQPEFASALGLEGPNRRKTVQRWESDGPSGPAGVAMTYLAQGALDASMKRVVPEHVFGGGLGEGGAGYDTIVRLWWPRFVAIALPASVPLTDEQQFVWLERDVERLVVALWIDDPSAFGGGEEISYLRRAATLAQEETIDSIDEFG